MKKIRPFAILMSFLIAIVGFVLSLLTNYASVDVPDFIKTNPVLLWSMIFGGLLVLVLLTTLQVLEPKVNRKAVKMSVIGSNTPLSSTLYKKDVFISYSHKNGQWVREKLLPALEQRGFSVIIDIRDFQAGSFSVEEMQRGVIDCKRVLIVLTPDYISSEWSKFENAMAQTQDPGALQRKLIPVLLENTSIPLRLQILHYRDLTNDDQQQWELLFRDLM
ncbi:toll/interleukin-1 receptor domain-containing protein [Oscillochloris sp. ZM17-4]|uniref:toll/interleukin-1 receptor domain-containing protein n=1 Tax=Oscillochloris sp. ZM17-4 TaxID=2866714 RepID=UPI001C73CC71|nr:toll/interleukin-1 receptor domain-containing protein [Oscillochloris sp. ZM17-4]MBX0329098.1 toll/interleukin-1 receptor domain-containing protein [Oscillochloris sp. ZM17-4]